MVRKRGCAGGGGAEFLGVVRAVVLCFFSPEIHKNHPSQPLDGPKSPNTLANDLETTHTD